MNKGTIIIVVLLVLILIALLYIIFNLKQNPNQEYQNTLKKIISLYRDILVKIDKIPNLKYRTFIELDTMDDIIKLQQEVRKPIYYLENPNCTDFVVISKDEVCFFTIKANPQIESPIEAYVEENEAKLTKTDNKILEDIDNTTIIKIEDGSVYKVSPMRVDKKKKKDRQPEEPPIIEKEIETIDDFFDEEEEEEEPTPIIERKKEDRAKMFKDKKIKESKKLKKNV